MQLWRSRRCFAINVVRSCNRESRAADDAAKPFLDSSSFGAAGFANMSGWSAFSGWRTRRCTWLRGLVLIVVAQTIFGHVIHIPNGPPPEVTVWLRPLLTFIGWLILAKAAAGFIAGWGLLQRQEWARIVALVVGFVALLNVPIGTALGVYTLWVLLPSQSDDEYKALAQAA